MTENEPFLGTGWSFPPTFERGAGGVRMISGIDDIRSSLELLLATEVGERIMQPRYGCSLRRLLFEPLDAALQAYVKDLIRTAILYFEPRVLLENVTLEPKQNEGSLEIRIECTIAATNTRANFVYPFYKAEGTEIVR
ncbi:MAG: hypothetical protein CVU57_20855 [Deltaproteobacteria bacterium HGW-Deltaproteobacteria-15]|jgi:hypothetical protein|nr:MAG: hypothetical protein CVU57_20855 [Deltaproteobacteria bacterium HGW-Deltaproteobacteria-15]